MYLQEARSNAIAIRILGLGYSPHGDGVRLQACPEATVCKVSTTSAA
ncbi:MAG: hypothetical protein QNJ72_25440 [Pleurocapsa sp. MO_226.B13]|nr:hypothetical protein [Pleurocapsa sp. MO_226.B13]